MKKNRFKFTRATFLKIFFICFALIISIKAIYIQGTIDPRLERLSQKQFQSKITTLPRRGYILDRSGEGLAISVKVHSLFIRPELLTKEVPKKQLSRVIANLSKILKTSEKDLNKKFKSTKGFVWIKRQLSESEEQSIRDRGLLEYGDSIALAEETKRLYPNRELAAHVLGSVNVDGNGIEGLELKYNAILNGNSARAASSKDAMGRRIYNEDNSNLAVKDGQSLILTIDKAIQYETEKSLRTAIETHQARAATAIVADVETGEILSMANYPSYNPNEPQKFPMDARRNRAITDTYEPGSTFKPLLIGMALEKGKSAKTKIYCEKGTFTVGGKRISEAESHEKYEWLSFSEILKFSSNVGAAKIALLLGSQNIAQLFDKLGLGNKTGIDLPGEVSGSANRQELKNQVRLANVGFGHGLTVTPIQMLSYYLAIANGGKWIQPKLVKAIISEDPEAIEKGSLRWKIGNQNTEQVTKTIFNTTVIKNLNEMLETVTQEGGTGIQAQLEEWPVAGKTGTSQKVDPSTKKYSLTKYMASFIGYAPSKKPKLVSLVIVDEPKNKYYASDTAAPAFHDIMKSSLLREGVQPINNASRVLQIANRSVIKTMETNPESTSAFITETSPSPQTREAINKIIQLEKLNTEIAVRDADKISLPETQREQKILLPNLKGLSVREALRTLGNESIEIEVVGAGLLREQYPAAEQWVSAGTKVKLIFDQP